MEITFEKTEIEGVLVVNYDKFQDNRGYIYTSYLDRLFSEQSLPLFTHDKFTFSKKNVLRGIHYDRNTTKLVTSIIGEIDQIVVDMRTDSKTYKKHLRFVMNNQKKFSVIIPPMVGNAFLVKSESSIYHYKLSYKGEYKDYNEQFTIKWNDPTLKICWGISNPILSERDQ